MEDVDSEHVGEGGHHLMTEHGDFEILKQSPMLGDNKFKLEIGELDHVLSHPSGLKNVSLAPTVSADGAPSSSPTTLTLYITSMMDFSQGEYEAYASMMAAIKCQDDRAGERGARPEWVWEFWQNDWVFRRESEVWGKFSSIIPCFPPETGFCRMPSTVSQLFA